MIITKEFEGEMSHIVRNCSTERCKKSIHGHSFKVLVSLYARLLDNAGMVYDFGLMKGSIKQFIDSFDHCMVFWQADDPEYIEMIKKHSDRWIGLPFNPSAEMLALFFLSGVQGILNVTKKENEESHEGIVVESVRYYETRTGSAEATEDDLRYLGYDSIFEEINGYQIEFSEAVKSDWSGELLSWINNGLCIKRDPFSFSFFENPSVEQQVIL